MTFVTYLTRLIRHNIEWPKILILPPRKFPELQPPERGIEESGEGESNVISHLLFIRATSISVRPVACLLCVLKIKGGKKKLWTYIGSELANVLRKRSNIPDLRHGHDSAYPTDQKSNQSSHTDRQFFSLVPAGPVIAVSTHPPSSENHLLLHGESDPDGSPVSHQSKKVGEDRTKMVPAHQRADSINDDPDSVPDKTRHFCRRRAKYLEINSARIGRCDCICYQPEGEDYAEKFPKWVQGG